MNGGQITPTTPTSAQPAQTPKTETFTKALQAIADHNNDGRITGFDVLQTPAVTNQEWADATLKRMDAERGEKPAVLIMAHNWFVPPMQAVQAMKASAGDRPLTYALQMDERFQTHVDELNKTDFAAMKAQDQASFVTTWQDNVMKTWQQGFTAPRPKFPDETLWQSNPVFNGDNVILNREALAPTSEQLRRQYLEQIAEPQTAPTKITDEQRQMMWNTMEMMLMARYAGAKIERLTPSNSAFGIDQLEQAASLADKVGKQDAATVWIVSSQPSQALECPLPKNDPYAKGHPNEDMQAPLGRSLQAMSRLIYTHSVNMVPDKPQTQILMWKGQPLSEANYLQLITENGTWPALGWDAIWRLKENQPPENPQARKD